MLQKHKIQLTLISFVLMFFCLKKEKTLNLSLNLPLHHTQGDDDEVVKPASLIQVRLVDKEFDTLSGEGLQFQGFVFGDEEFAKAADGGIVECLPVLGVASPQGLADGILAESVGGCNVQQHLQQGQLVARSRTALATPQVEALVLQVETRVSQQNHG